MDHKQEQFMRMQQYQYAPQMPFYMSYPIQNIYMTEMEYERDMERMKELYPEEAKRIQKLVDNLYTLYYNPSSFISLRLTNKYCT